MADKEIVNVPAVSMAELVALIVKKIVDEPDNVKVVEIRGTSRVLIEIHVPRRYRGQVIGKKGYNADCIRGLLDAASGKERIRYQLDIIG